MRPGNVLWADWVTTSFVRSSYKSEPRMILHDDSYDEKSPDYEKTLEAETKEADVYWSQGIDQNDSEVLY